MEGANTLILVPLHQRTCKVEDFETKILQYHKTSGRYLHQSFAHQHIFKITGKAWHKDTLDLED